MNTILSSYDWVYGIAQLAAGFLAIIAAIIAMTMFGKSNTKLLRAWKFLLIAVLVFAIEEVIGAMKTFGIYVTPHLTHIIPGIILGLLITALIIQININRGWLK
ncbi:hypothetical protein KY304_02130 [Candidatus Woesearchaeota archaeon]|nr:hypothetical protein [Candidatus Woesearchaeota archaeon]